MSRINIILNDFHAELVGDVIGVDYGAWVCVQKKQDMNLACGDFDSVSFEQLELIENAVSNVHHLSPQKDMTDFSYALSLCDGYDEVYVYGALGGRRDHEYIHVMALMRDSRIKLFDNQNLMYRLDSGSYEIEKLDYDYISFFVIKPGILTLKGFKYSLDHHSTHYFDAHMSSNELIGDKGRVILEKGALLVIQAKSSNH